MDNKNLTIEELEKISGGKEDRDVVFLLILDFIEMGQDISARALFRSSFDELTTIQKDGIRFKFHEKFGYSID